MATQRVHIYYPKWEEVERWVFVFCARNSWRVQGYEVEDLVQEMWMVFVRVERQYPDVIDPPHFMTLFRMACWGKVCDLAKKGRRFENEYVVRGVSADDLVDQVPDAPTAELSAMLTAMPYELAQDLRHAPRTRQLASRVAEYLTQDEPIIDKLVAALSRAIAAMPPPAEDHEDVPAANVSV